MTNEEKTELQPLSNHAPDRITAIVCAYVSHNQVPMDRIGDLIATVTAALNGNAMAKPSLGIAPADKPAVPIKKSVGDDFIICLEDGKKLTMLKRYLRSQYDMSPEDYRKKWGLPHDYPMCAPGYAKLRSQFAKKIGLGRIPTRTKAKKT